MKLSIMKVKTCDKLKLEPIHASSRNTLRKIYKPKENVRFPKLKPIDVGIIIAKHGENIVGTAKIMYFEDRLHLMGLGILEEYRNKGTCRLIIKFAIEEAKANDINTVSLYTIRETGNVDIFSKMGFEVVTDEITDDFTSEIYETLHEVYMIHRLDKCIW